MCKVIVLVYVRRNVGEVLIVFCFLGVYDFIGKIVLKYEMNKEIYKIYDV